MDAPVDEHAAAGDSLVGEIAAQAGDGAVGPEANVHVVDVAKAALVDVLLDAVDAVVKAVDHTDVQHLAGFVLGLLHFQGLGIGAGGGLFAEDVFPGAQSVYGDLGMDVVGGADGNRLHLGVAEHLVIVLHRGAAAVFLHSGLGALWDDVAEILDFRLVIVQVRRDMGGVGNGAAADDGNFHLPNNSFFRIYHMSFYGDYIVFF